MLIQLTLASSLTPAPLCPGGRLGRARAERRRHVIQRLRPTTRDARARKPSLPRMNDSYRAQVPPPKLVTLSTLSKLSSSLFLLGEGGGCSNAMCVTSDETGMSHDETRSWLESHDVMT